LLSEQVELTEEAPRALTGDLVSGAVADRRLALEDDDERIAGVTDPEQELALRGRALLAPAAREPEAALGRESGSADSSWTCERGYRPSPGRTLAGVDRASTDARLNRPLDRHFSAVSDERPLVYPVVVRWIGLTLRGVL
jgi:hypothetical protein